MTLDEKCESVFELLLDYEITRVREWPRFFKEFMSNSSTITLEPSRVLKSTEFVFWNKSNGCSIDSKNVHEDDIENVEQVNLALLNFYRTESGWNYMELFD